MNYYLILLLYVLRMYIRVYVSRSAIIKKDQDPRALTPHIYCKNMNFVLCYTVTRRTASPEIRIWLDQVLRLAGGSSVVVPKGGQA